jgi:hypothetical protein
MGGIAIHDLENGGLTFDLRDILTALGPPALASEWRVRADAFSYTADVDVPIFESRRQTSAWIDGVAFAEAAQAVIQVIEGVFEGRRPGDTVPWLTLRAVDSSWWEVYSDDPSPLEALKRTFKDVRPARYEASRVFSD